MARGRPIGFFSLKAESFQADEPFYDPTTFPLLECSVAPPPHREAGSEPSCA